MRYRDFVKLAGPEQSRVMEGLDWEQRYVLVFEAFLAMERKHDDLRAEVAPLLGELAELRTERQSMPPQRMTRLELAESVLQRNEEIRDLHAHGAPASELARQFGISKDQVRNVLRVKLHKGSGDGSLIDLASA